jgi:hypothetical protein
MSETQSRVERVEPLGTDHTRKALQIADSLLRAEARKARRAHVAQIVTEPAGLPRAQSDDREKLI